MRRRASRERGAVLVVVLLIMVVLLGMGITAMWLSSGNLQVGASNNMRMQALYVAEAGLERAKEILNAPTAPVLNALLNPASASLPAVPQDNVPLGVNDAGVPNGVGAVLRDPNLGNVALAAVAYPPASFGRVAAGQPSLMGWYTVWIRNDTSEARRGFPNSEPAAPNGNNTIVLRSEGVAFDNRTRVVLEVTLGPNKTPAVPTDAGAAVAEEPEYTGKGLGASGQGRQAGVVWK